MQEVWDMKDRAYEDFLKSGCKDYLEYIKRELRSVKINYEEPEPVSMAVREKSEND